MLRDLRRQCQRSAQPSPIGSGRAHARRTAIHKHTISGRAARGRSEPPWVDHRHVASGAPTPLTDARNRWSSQPTGSIRIESKLRLSPRVHEPGLTRGDFRQLSMHRERFSTSIALEPWLLPLREHRLRLFVVGVHSCDVDTDLWVHHALRFAGKSNIAVKLVLSTGGAGLCVFVCFT